MPECPLLRGGRKRRVERARTVGELAPEHPPRRPGLFGSLDKEQVLGPNDQAGPAQPGLVQRLAHTPVVIKEKPAVERDLHLSRCHGRPAVRPVCDQRQPPALVLQIRRQIDGVVVASNGGRAVELPGGPEIALPLDNLARVGIRVPRVARRNVTLPDRNHLFPVLVGNVNRPNRVLDLGHAHPGVQPDDLVCPRPKGLHNLCPMRPAVDTQTRRVRLSVDGVQRGRVDAHDVRPGSLPRVDLVKVGRRVSAGIKRADHVLAGAGVVVRQVLVELGFHPTPLVHIALEEPSRLVKGETDIGVFHNRRCIHLLHLHSLGVGSRAAENRRPGNHKVGRIPHGREVFGKKGQRVL